MSEKKVCIIGNSVPLLIQPFRTNHQDRTYGELLERSGCRVIHAEKQSAVITDVYQYLEDECIRHYPDYVIIHFGIVEATYRARPRWLQNIFSMNAWNNSIINRSYNGPIMRGILYVAKQSYKSLERILYASGLKWRWVSPRTFRFALHDIVKKIFADTPVQRIILVGITDIADWVEQRAPGTQVSINKYNLIMKKLADEYPAIHYFDTASQINNKTQTITPDGIHFTGIGHQLLFEALYPLLSPKRSDYQGWQKINQYESLYNLYARWNKRKASHK